MSDEEPLLPQNVLDGVAFGRRLRSLRVLHGYDRGEELSAALRARYGVCISVRTIYAIERGEQMPHLDLFFAVVDLLEAPADYFLPAIRHDVGERIFRRWRG